jgi:hypothetical protein
MPDSSETDEIGEKMATGGSHVTQVPLLAHVARTPAFRDEPSWICGFAERTPGFLA